MTVSSISAFVSKSMSGTVGDHLHGSIDPAFAVEALDGVFDNRFERVHRLLHVIELGNHRKLANDIDHALDPFFQLVGAALELFRRIEGVAHQIEVSDDDPEQIVEIVGDAFDHMTHRRLLPHFGQTALQFEILAMVLLNVELRVDAGNGFIEIDRLRDIIRGTGSQTFSFPSREVFAVMKMTGMFCVRSFSFRRRQTSNPSTSGIMMSRRMMSGGSFSAISIACSPR